MVIRRIPVTTLASGSELNLYLHEIKGSLGDGPTVGISAAIHGDEPTGTEILLHFARRVRQVPFRGRLLLLPVANPLGYEAVDRSTPLDSINLNRVFPGDAKGWLTEQLAAVITEEFLNRIDVFIDLHSGGDSQTVDYVYIINDEKLSRSFGSKVLYRPKQGLTGTVFSGTSATITEARGVPTVTVELGGGRVDQSAYVTRGVDGLFNMLRTLEIIDEEPEPALDQIVINEILTVRPRMGGLLISEAPALGEEIQGGAVLGRVFSPHTFEELETIRNPLERGIMILSHLTTDVVWPGDYGYMVGNLATAEGTRR